MTDTNPETTEPEKVRVPNVSAGAVSGLAHHPIGSDSDDPAGSGGGFDTAEVELADPADEPPGNTAEATPDPDPSEGEGVAGTVDPAEGDGDGQDGGQETPEGTPDAPADPTADGDTGDGSEAGSEAPEGGDTPPE